MGGLACLLLTPVVISVIHGTPLDDYVHAFDPHYSYTLLYKVNTAEYSLHMLNMTSQKWLTEKVTKTPIWWHYLSIIVPYNLNYNDTAFVWIDGGNNKQKPPSDKNAARFSAVAVQIGAVFATITQIPNQPTVFWKDPKLQNRTEDNIIAWTWREFLLNGSNPDILLRLPMTKAVVRGFDTVSSYMHNVAQININKFIVAGASKRGWTTWTTAAVDKRVIGMVPCVMDLLNLQKSMHHHFRSLGGWSFALGVYYTMDIFQYLDSPNFSKMQAIVDPLTYSDRFSMPKMIVSASGDQYFLLDDSDYYFRQLPGPKFLRIVPNAAHAASSGHEAELIQDLQGFLLNIFEKATFPKLQWVRSQNITHGKITVSSSLRPKEVTMFHAKTLDGLRRDFRLYVKNPSTGQPVIHPVSWKNGTVTRITDTLFEAVIEKPQVGWAALFIMLKFPGQKGSRMDFTTDVNIVPDIFPFPDCSGETCQGTLV